MSPVRPHLERFAAIDLGTNSVLLLIAERGPGGQLQPIADRGYITRLGEGLQATGLIQEEPADRTQAVLSEFLRLAEESQVRKIAVVGTNCLRTASNADEFITRIRSVLGLDIQVISGEEEARLTFLGARSGLPASLHKLVLFDLGGGSTEFVYGDGDQIDERLSLEVGVVRCTERHLPRDPVSEADMEGLVRHLVEDAFRQIRPVPGMDALVGVGGTLTTMAAVMLGMTTYDGLRVHATRLSREEVERQVHTYREQTIEQRRKIPGMEPGRADVILAGAVMVRVVMQMIQAEDLVISDRALRHGLLHDRFSGSDA